jgi:hypothetical protein
MSFLDTFRRTDDAPDRDVLVSELSAHFEKWFGPGHIEAPVSDAFIQVRTIPPTERFPFRVIHTVGMSAKPMKTKKGQEPFAELMMILPTEWSYGKDPEWPAREMKRFAMMFHDMSSCISEFITIPFMSYPAPMPGTFFTGLMAVRPQFVPPAAHRVELSSGQTIRLYCLMPLSLVEMKYVVTQPEPEALWCLAREQHRDPLELLLVDPRRPNIA